MEINYHEAFLTMFKIGIIGMLFFMLLAALLRKNPKKQSIDELNNLYKANNKGKLIEEAQYLNKQLEKGLIEPVMYLVDMDILKVRFKKAGFNPVEIDRIIDNSVLDQREFSQMVMSNIVKLRNEEKITHQEFEKRIDSQLDKMPKK